MQVPWGTSSWGGQRKLSRDLGLVGGEPPRLGERCGQSWRNAGSRNSMWFRPTRAKATMGREQEKGAEVGGARWWGQRAQGLCALGWS